MTGGDKRELFPAGRSGTCSRTRRRCRSWRGRRTGGRRPSGWWSAPSARGGAGGGASPSTTARRSASSSTRRRRRGGRTRHVNLPQSTSRRQRDAHLKTTIVVPVAFVVGSAIVAVPDSERAACCMIATLQLVDDQTKKKNPGFHTGLVKMYENEHQPPEKGEKRCILSSFPVYGSEISVMMANSRNYRCTSVTNWSQITYLAPSAQNIGILDLVELSTTHYFTRPGTHQFTNYLI